MALKNSPIHYGSHYHKSDVIVINSPDALDADLLRVGMSTLRLAGDACGCVCLGDGLHETIRITVRIHGQHTAVH